MQISLRLQVYSKGKRTCGDVGHQFNDPKKQNVEVNAGAERGKGETCSPIKELDEEVGEDQDQGGSS